MIDKKAFTYLSDYLRQKGMKKEDSFLNSPVYYALTGRHGTRLYQGFGSLLVVCRHPTQHDTLLVFPEIGQGDGKLTRFFLNHTNIVEQHICLARYSQHEMETLLEALEDNPLDTPVKLITEKADNMDWLYPIHILDTHSISTMQGSEFRNIRQKYRQALKSPLRMHHLHNSNGIEYAKAAHKYWQGNQIVINIEKNKNNMNDYYDGLFHMIEEYPSFFDGFIHFYNNKPIGFTIWDTQKHNNTVNLIANIGDTSIKGLSEYQIVSACDYLSQKGITHLNRGGSENASLNGFKEKFNPTKTIHRISLYVEPQETSPLAIQTFDMIHNLEKPISLL